MGLARNGTARIRRCSTPVRWVRGQCVAVAMPAGQTSNMLPLTKARHRRNTLYNRRSRVHDHERFTSITPPFSRIGNGSGTAASAGGVGNSSRQRGLNKVGRNSARTVTNASVVRRVGGRRRAAMGKGNNVRFTNVIIFKRNARWSGMSRHHHAQQ